MWTVLQGIDILEIHHLDNVLTDMGMKAVWTPSRYTHRSFHLSRRPKQSSDFRARTKGVREREAIQFMYRSRRSPTATMPSQASEGTRC